MKKQFKPGEIAERSGLYEVVGPRGGKTGTERTVARGERLPPTPTKNSTYELVRATRNGAGEGR